MWRRLMFLLRRSSAAAELDEEMQLHLELLERRLRDEGVPAEEAARQARLRFGNRTSLGERGQEAWGWSWLDGLVGDLRYALRLLRGRPLFALVVVATLALGIGPNVATFTVMNAIVLRHLPVPDPERVVYVQTSGTPRYGANTGTDQLSFSYAAFDRLRQQRDAAEVMAFVPVGGEKTAVRIGDLPEEALGMMVSGNFFSGLRVGATCGRLLTPADEREHLAVAVLGHGFWTRRFGGDCAVIGRSIQVRGVSFAIVGVAADGFAGADRNSTTDLWIPFQERLDLNAWGQRAERSFLHDPKWWCLMLVARLAPGLGEEGALARLQPTFRQAAYEREPPRPGEKPVTLSFASARGLAQLRDRYQEPLTLMLAMVLVVLVIACVNVALLLAARNETRRREFALRLALGGGRWQLLRQLLAESLVLVAGGAALGWLFALGATRVMVAWSGLDDSIDLAPGRNVFLFAALVSSGATLLFGLLPLRSASAAPMDSQRAAGATALQGPSALARRTLVVVQVSLCLVLLVGAGLLSRSMSNLERIPLGLRPQGLLVFGLSPTRGDSHLQTVTFYRTLLERLRALPGVEAATVMENRIGSGWSNNTGMWLDGGGAGDRATQVRWNSIGPDYFRTLGVPVLLGRELRDSDGPDDALVAVVNQTFVNRFRPGGNLLGRNVSMSSRHYQIVGVVADSKYTGVREDPTPMAYFSYAQMDHTSAMHVELRTAGSAVGFLPVVRRTVAELAADLPLQQPRTQSQQFARTLTDDRLIARFATFFGLLATVLVATGLYGTLAYAVNRRTAEIGVRMALGAQRGHVLWMVLRESLMMCAAGIALGLPLALLGSRALGGLLYGVTPADPPTLGVALGGLVLVAVAASLLPARRATAVPPMVALRAE